MIGSENGVREEKGASGSTSVVPNEYLGALIKSRHVTCIAPFLSSPSRLVTFLDLDLQVSTVPRLIGQRHERIAPEIPPTSRSLQALAGVPPRAIFPQDLQQELSVPELSGFLSSVYPSKLERYPAGIHSFTTLVPACQCPARAGGDIPCGRPGKEFSTAHPT